MTSFADLEARLAALEVDRVKAFAALREELNDHRQEMRVSFRRVGEQLAEIRDLLVDGCSGRRSR